MTENKTHNGKSTEYDTAEPTPGDTVRRAALPPENCSLAVLPHWVAGEKQSGFLYSFSSPGGAVRGSPLLAQEAESRILTSSSFSAVQCSSGHYCNDSGMVLTTWVVSVAVGGEPKKVLVWFL